MVIYGVDIRFWPTLVVIDSVLLPYSRYHDSVAGLARTIYIHRI